MTDISSIVSGGKPGGLKARMWRRRHIHPSEILSDQ